MTVINREITDEEVIPVVETDLFADQPSARFAVGIVALGNEITPGLESVVDGYFALRRNVYFEQTGQLAETDIQPDGTDRDEDDARSVAFAIVENRIRDQRVVAAKRLIIKGFGADVEEQRPLPVEEFCPDIFAESPATPGSLEVSRLIARHEKAAIKEVLRWQLYAAAVGYVATHDLGPAYGVVEPWLQRYLEATVPVRAIGDQRYIPHYMDYNLPIEIDRHKLIEQMRMTHPGIIEQMQANEGAMTFFGRVAPVRPRQPVDTESDALNEKTLSA